MQTFAVRIPTDAELTQARAILDLNKRGWTRAEIRKLFRISEATYFRRLQLAREVEDRRRGEDD